MFLLYIWEYCFITQETLLYNCIRQEVMTKRNVGNTYSDRLFEGPDFSELCNHNGNCGYVNCRFRHYGDNPHNALMKKLHKKIASKKKKKEEEETTKRKTIKQEEKSETRRPKRNYEREIE